MAMATKKRTFFCGYRKHFSKSKCCGFLNNPFLNTAKTKRQKVQSLYTEALPPKKLNKGVEGVKEKVNEEKRKKRKRDRQ